MFIPIIPKPNKVVRQSGVFPLDGPVSIHGLEPGSLLNQLRDILGRHTRLSIELDAAQSVAFVRNESLAPEAYTLDVGDHVVTIEASRDNGFFYALMTLQQLMAVNESLEGLRIEDSPRYAHRGLLLDSSRHFIPKREVLRALGLAAMLKLNRLHWHLTDDQGWRVEIGKYPALTAKGAQRLYSVTEKMGLKQEYPHSGYYTRQDIREVVACAEELHIGIIPEIDMPGHVRSAICACPELLCSPRELPVPSRPGIYEDVLCLGKESTYEFVFDVLDEVSALFPYHQVHIGGDEVPKGRWFACPHCMEAAKRNNLHSGHELQGYFLNRVIQHLKSLGKQAVTWNESIADAGLDRDAVCQYWMASRTDLPAVKDAFKSGRAFVDSSFGHYYFDYPDFMTPMRKCYAYESIFEPDNSRGNLLGIECALWTEFVPNAEVLNTRLFPRILAFAESAWSQKEAKDYPALLENVKNLKGLLKDAGVELTPEKEWDVPGFIGGLKTANYMRKLVKPELIKVMLQIKKENRVRFNEGTKAD